MEKVVHAGLVYESPDKGKTVYVRNAGEVSRKLLSSLASTPDDLTQNMVGDKTNAPWQDTINACIMSYKSSRGGDGV